MNFKHRKIILGSCILTLFIIFLLFKLFQRPKDPSLLLLYGNVDVRQVDISFREKGQIATLLFEEGDAVKQGQLMCTLNPTPYDSQLEEAIAAEASIKVRLDLAEILLQRRKELIVSGAVSQEDLDHAQASKDQLFANWLEAKAAVNIAQDHLLYTQAHAPTDGIILTRIREPGTVVNPTDPVYTLSVSSPVWIRAFVDQPDLGEIFYGMQAEVFTDIPEGKIYQGQVGFISPLAEFTPKTVETTKLRTDLVFRLRVYVNDPDHCLVQGMPVTVRLKKEKNKSCCHG